MSTICQKLKLYTLIAGFIAAILSGCNERNSGATSQTAAPSKEQTSQDSIGLGVSSIDTPQSDNSEAAETRKVNVNDSPQKLSGDSTALSVEKGSEMCPYETTIEAGIDFGRPCWPSIIKTVEGVSEPRWNNVIRVSDATKAPSVKIVFSRGLPKSFTLIIDGVAMPKNSKVPVKITAGMEHKNIVFKEEYSYGLMSRRPFEELRVDMSLRTPTDTIEITPYNPITYKEGGYESDDIGLWGIAIRSIRLIEK